MTPSATLPGVKHLMLLGGGHAHVQVLQGLARSRPADLAITVVAPVARQLYSGMVPGFVAGHYRLEQCVIPLAGLIADCNARLIEASAVAVDAKAKAVTLSNGETLSWDWLSLNTGPVMDRERIEAQMPGAREHALFVRPIEGFCQLWPRVAAIGRARPLRLAVVGAGAAGLELAMAAAHALGQTGYSPGSQVSLITGGPPPGQSYPKGVQRRLADALQRLNVAVLRDACVGISSGQILLAGGASLACDAPVLAVGAQAPGWLAPSGLALDSQGFVAVNSFQQSTSHAQVFAAGDIASRIDSPHPRSGVHAVRAGPPLLANLRAACRGQALAPYAPPQRTLNLISCGGRHAIAAWGGLQVEGRWVWQIKDRIDRAFVRRYASS